MELFLAFFFWPLVAVLFVTLVPLSVILFSKQKRR
jgi:hypothetical protein